jgi:hypothetical protein
MTLREFREKTRDLDENLILMSLYGEYDYYHFIDYLKVTNFISSKVDDEFAVASDEPLNEKFAGDNDVSMEDLETTKVILLN